MTVPTVFIDTNVLIYAHDLDSGEKHDEAAKLILTAWNEVMKRYQLSWWDSMIVAAAQRADADILWTEDLNEGQQFGGLKVVNPLK